MVLVPREALGCVLTHYSVGTFIAVPSGDVKLVRFWFLGRCQDGLVLVPREALGCVSTHYSVGTFLAVHSGDVRLV